MAAAAGLWHTTIRRIWGAFGLEPHRSETFKLSILVAQLGAQEDHGVAVALIEDLLLEEFDGPGGGMSSRAANWFASASIRACRSCSRRESASRSEVEHRTDDLILAEAYRMVTIREGDKTIELPAIQAAMRSLAISAMKGSRLSQKALAEIAREVEHRREAVSGGRQHSGSSVRRSSPSSYS